MHAIHRSLSVRALALVLAVAASAPLLRANDSATEGASTLGLTLSQPPAILMSGQSVPVRAIIWGGPSGALPTWWVMDEAGAFLALGPDHPLMGTPQPGQVLFTAPAVGSLARTFTIRASYGDIHLDRDITVVSEHPLSPQFRGDTAPAL